MKRIAIMLLISFLLFGLCGCQKKIVKTETEIVDAIIYEVRSSSYGGLVIFQYNGAKENVYVFDTSFDAEYWKSNKGNTVKATLITYIYEDNSTTYELIYSDYLNKE